MTTITPEQRDRLLKNLRASHHPLVVAADLGLDGDAVVANPELRAEALAAFKTGVARLSNRVVDGALKNGQPHVLERVAAERAAEEHDLFRAPAAKMEGDGFDLSALSELNDFELDIAEALLTANIQEFQRLLREYAVELV